MTRILAIDPGPAESAWVLLVDGRPVRHEKVVNDRILELLRRLHLRPSIDDLEPDVVVIEQIEPRYGLNPGWTTLDTARWVGRFEEAASPLPVVRLTRSQVLGHLGIVTRGPNRVSADAGVRAALIDRFGGHGGKGAAIGRKAAPGPLHGITADRWAALAVAVTYLDTHPEAPR